MREWYTDTTLSVWRYFSSGLPNTVRVTDLAMHYNPTPECNCSILYGSTYNRGTWFSSIYNDGTSKPVAMLDPYDTIICRSSVLSFNSKSCNNPGRFKWEFSPNNTSYMNGTDSSSENPSVTFSSAGTYSFKFMAENCIGTDTMPGIVLVGDTVITACQPTTTGNVSGLGIFNVEMNGVSRASSGRNPEGAYIDQSCNTVFRVQKGKTYALKVTTGATYTEQVKAFIDYNNNGTLNDAGEVVYQPAAALTNHIDSITIPTTATAGTILRMRIKSDYTSTGTNPCSNLNYGQTEDYGLYIESNNVSPKFVNDNTPICAGNSVQFTDSTTGTGFNYAWDFGLGASPATANGTGPYNVTYSSPGYKTVQLTVDGKVYKVDSAVLVLSTPSLTISFSNGDSQNCVNQAFTLLANDASAGSPSFQWYKNSSLITDSTYSSYHISNANLNDSGTYSVIAKNGSCADTASQQVYVGVYPNSNFSINDNTQC
ncbi:MAG: GEVED domain-containing protein, partial [Bacteroidia bacterium]